MKFAVAALLFIPIPAFAGWFGPSTAADCAAAYGKAAADTHLVRAAAAYCAVAFDDSKSTVERRRAECIAKRIPTIKTGAALRYLIEECAASNAAPECSEEATNRCVDPPPGPWNHYR